MIEVKNRSVESWGPLAKVDQKVFDKLLSKPNARDEVKSFIKKAKKLKTYKITFIKELVSDQFEVQAESDYDVSSKAREFFNENKDAIDFALKPKDKWESRYAHSVEYDRMMYTKVRS